MGMVVNIRKAVIRVRDKSQISRSVKKFGTIAGKLMALAVVVFILWVVRASIAAAHAPIIANFNVDARKWADCMKAKASSGTWASQVVSFVSKNVACLHKDFCTSTTLPHKHVFLTHSSTVTWYTATRFRM